MGQTRRIGPHFAARSRIPALAGVVTFLSAASARAELAPIEWHAPPHCGSAAELSLGVARLLRSETADVIHERFVARVVQEARGRYQLSLQGITPNGSWTRTLIGASCLELHDAAIVMIALAIAPSRADAIAAKSGANRPSTADASGGTAASLGPVGASTTPTGARTEGSSNGSVDANSTTPLPVAPLPVAPLPVAPLPAAMPPAVTPAPTTNSTPSHESEASRRQSNAASASIHRADVTLPRKTNSAALSGSESIPARVVPPSPLVPPRWATALFVRSGLVAGVLPRLTPLFALGAARAISHLQLVSYLGWMLEQTAHSPVDPSQGARVQMGFASTEVGFAWLEGPLELGVHASLQGGVMTAKSTAARNDQRGLGPFGAVGAGFSMALPAESVWAGVLSADGWMNAISPNFQITELGRVYQPGLVAGILGLSLRARLK